jgi:hypothetical protein
LKHTTRRNWARPKTATDEATDETTDKLLTGGNFVISLINVRTNHEPTTETLRPLLLGIEVVVGIFFVNETITGLGGMLMPNIYQRMGSDTPNRRYTVTWDIQEIDTTRYT